MPSTLAHRLAADVFGMPCYVPGRAAPSDLMDKLSLNENPYPRAEIPSEKRSSCGAAQEVRPTYWA